MGISAIGIVALGLTIGWDILADDAWLPEPYQVYSVAGAWIENDNVYPEYITIMTFSPEDPRTGTGLMGATEITLGPTWGGDIPEATSTTDWFG